MAADRGLPGGRSGGGQVRPGERLPTEHELARAFGVNRHTLRRALGDMEERGLLRVEQGRGTFVQEPVILYSITRRTRFAGNLSRQSREPGRELVRGEQVEASGAMAEALGIEPGAPLLHLEVLGLADNRPVSIGGHYFPLPRFAGMKEAYQQTLSVTESLRRCGVEEYFRRQSRVTARLPSGRDARLLRQPKTRPVLVSESVNVDADGAAIEYGLARFAGDWVQLVFEP